MRTWPISCHGAPLEVVAGMYVALAMAYAAGEAVLEVGVFGVAVEAGRVSNGRPALQVVTRARDWRRNRVLAAPSW